METRTRNYVRTKHRSHMGNPIFDYLQNNILTKNKDVAQKIKATSARFTIIQGNLYRGSFSGPYLTCVKPS